MSMPEITCPKKHKKHKSEKRERHGSPHGEDGAERPQGLKLILKVGSQNTPEHSTDFPFSGDASHCDPTRSHHKKSKKKKKKKDKCKDREKRHKHHHKDKKRKRDESLEDPEDDGNDDELQPGEVQKYLQMLGLGSPYREPRTCVIRKIQERSTLQRMLEHVHKAIEKKDPQQFFAWPVTDNIAPGYSAIITNPMDLSTMRQKIDDNEYKDMQEFMDDFKLMCTNAMKYNHADTIYYKASKKLLHAGLKLALPEKSGWILQLMPEVTNKELGYEIPPEIRAEYKVPDKDALSPLAKRRMPLSKFEAIPDDLDPEEILARVQKAAREAKSKLAARRGGPSMGFLRQRKDGTTHLNILVGGDGVIPGTKKRPVLLGNLVGKLTEGTGQLQGFREDRRNVAKPVRPLYYGAFGSYAPSYDSAFANLSKEESELVYQTYGSDSAVQYAESILDFARDCDYTVYMVDSLLDLMTGGEHSKTKKILDERKQLREEEEAVKTVLETKPQDAVKIDIDSLRSLTELGIDVEFLDGMRDQVRSAEEQSELQEKLNSMSGLLDKLHKIQYHRLSQAVPTHLSTIQGPGEEEVTLADAITGGLTDIAKRLNPSDIVPVAGVRKALGVVGPEPEPPAPPPAIVLLQPPQEVDLESELRQFLESENNLVDSPLRADDKTIEEILME